MGAMECHDGLACSWSPQNSRRSFETLPIGQAPLPWVQKHAPMLEWRIEHFLERRRAFNNIEGATRRRIERRLGNGTSSIVSRLSGPIGEELYECIIDGVSSDQHE
jgi:hypothetical protein